MTRTRLSRWLSLVLVAGLTSASFHASPEDIDIFSVDEGSSINPPNVLIILDNSANWARAAQQWPDDPTQGQSEVAAIKQVISELDGSINVGLMMYVSEGNVADEAHGYVRAHIRPMIPENRDILSGHLDKIYEKVNDEAEKRSSNNPYGDLMRSAYAYFAGSQHPNLGASTSAELADTAAYDTNYSDFRTPLTTNDTCTRTIIIFIGNNTQGQITADSTANVESLRSLATNAYDPPDTAAGNAAVEQIRHAQYTVTSTPATDQIGYADACMGSAASCTSSLNQQECSENGYESCSCDSTIFQSCPMTHWLVSATNIDQSPKVVSDPPPEEFPGSPTGETTLCAKETDPPTAACTFPASSTTTTTESSIDPVTGETVTTTTTTTTSWKAGTCKWVYTGQQGACTGSRRIWERRGTKIVDSIITTDRKVVTTDTLGETSACYQEQASCNPNDPAWDCSKYSEGCTCTQPTTTTGCGAGSNKKFMVTGKYTVQQAQQTGLFTDAPAGPLMMDEWARFMRSVGVAVPGLSQRNQVTTYTIDVFNAQQEPNLSGLWFNAARVGGGKYFQAKDKQAIISALRNIFTEVQAVNSAFSSASLPINATNRSQNENQIFIGVFKPDRTKDPLWFGNLKRFEAIRDGATITLGDQHGNRAINNQTGFLSECASSFWTTDSGDYWLKVVTDDPEARGICTTNSTNDSSDDPDGPFVEKGAAAEVMRKGNNPNAAPDASGNYTLNRTVKTLSGGALVDFTAATFDDGDATTDETAEGRIVDFIKGHDIDDDDVDKNVTEVRSTVHGDVVHSRPQPVNYGDGNRVVVYYGANDGLFRAVSGETGRELWSFVAPEHHKKLARLRFSGQTGNPLIKYFGDTTPGALPKDYFFDGSTGLYQKFNSDNTTARAIIFPTMRRGGRKIYAFDVSNPNSPSYLWSKGCPNLTDDVGCDAGFEKIGQTWSLASVGFIKGYDNGNTPVVITGGGYDRCDDEDVKTPCAATKGQGVYVINAITGALVRHFDFTVAPAPLNTGDPTPDMGPSRGVAADIAMISMNPDKFVDYAYAADTGGNIYRLDFVTDAGTLAPITDATKWKYSRVAYTNGAFRKFLFPPALVQNGSRIVYLAIGTGDREHPLRQNYPFGIEGDPNSAVKNRFYVFKDDVGDLDPNTQLNLDSEASPNNMADYTVDPGCTAEKVTPGSGKRGWFMELIANGQGEQVVTSAIIAKGIVNFSTNRPTPPSTEACSSSLGEALGYQINLLTASGVSATSSCGAPRFAEFVGGGLPPSPVIATIRIGDRVETVVIGAADPEGVAGSALETRLRNPDLDRKRRPVYWYKSSGDN